MKQTYPAEICKDPHTTSAKKKKVSETSKPSHENEKVQLKKISSCYKSPQSRDSDSPSKDCLQRSRDTTRVDEILTLSQSPDNFSKNETSCEAQNVTEKCTANQKVSMSFERKIVLNKIVRSNHHVK